MYRQWFPRGLNCEVFEVMTETKCKTAVMAKDIK
jgi:hypothetical protein